MPTAKRQGRLLLSKTKQAQRAANQAKVDTRTTTQRLLSSDPARLDASPSPKRPHTELDTIYLPDVHLGWL